MSHHGQGISVLESLVSMDVNWRKKNRALSNFSEATGSIKEKTFETRAPHAGINTRRDEKTETQLGAPSERQTRLFVVGTNDKTGLAGEKVNQLGDDQRMISAS